MVTAMLGAVLDLLEVDKRRAAAEEEEILDRAVAATAPHRARHEPVA